MIYDPYILQNGLYVAAPISRLEMPNPVPQVSRQQRRAQQRRMHKDIRKVMKSQQPRLQKSPVSNDARRESEARKILSV